VPVFMICYMIIIGIVLLLVVLCVLFVVVVVVICSSSGSSSSSSTCSSSSSSSSIGGTLNLGVFVLVCAVLSPGHVLSCYNTRGGGKRVLKFSAVV
jgi:hypothetical protein